VNWAQAFQRGATLFTIDGACTPRYASPERLQGRVSAASDQYSLAITICELVAGRHPFEGPGEEQLADRLAGRMNLNFLPDPLRPAICRALDPNPAKRHRSCPDLIAALAKALMLSADAGSMKTLMGINWDSHDPLKAGPPIEVILWPEEESPAAPLPIDPEPPRRRMSVPMRAWAEVRFALDWVGGRVGSQFAEARPWHVGVAFTAMVVVMSMIPGTIFASLANQLLAARPR
jgi:serine/threonine protein kinase